MANKQLIIDDDYCRALGDFFVKQGEHMDGVIAEYVSILQEIKNSAITSGDVSNALGEYISYAQKLNDQIGNISITAKTHIDKFLTSVDDADQYLF